MAVIKTVSVSAENTFSEKFGLVGDAPHSRIQGRALICATRDDSTVTLRRYEFQR